MHQMFDLSAAREMSLHANFGEHCLFANAIQGLLDVLALEMQQARLQRLLVAHSEQIL